MWQDLQYKMFLLNRFGRNNLGQFDIFTIQNVPIKSTENNRYLFKNLDLQYKMFLLNKDMSFFLLQ